MGTSITINDRVYGQWRIDDPLAVLLIELPQFKRLYKVGQYGSYWFGLPEANTNRAEHSLGVYYLLRYFGATRQEQIAGLLHDISHTVFSHVIDYVYDDLENQGTQDKNHLSIIEKSNIRNILSENGVDYKKIADLERHTFLDRKLPDICCDRLDYFLRDSICYSELSPKEAIEILRHIVFIGGTFAVDDPDVARFMSLHSIMMSEKYWGPPFGCFLFERTSQAIKRALETGAISENDFYLDDFTVWDKMRASGDEDILSALWDVENIKNLKLCLDNKEYDMHTTSKFRAIDPYVFDENSFRRVSEIFPDILERFNQSRRIFEKGYRIKVIRD